MYMFYIFHIILPNYTDSSLRIIFIQLTSNPQWFPYWLYKSASRFVANLIMLANCLAAHSTKAHWLMSISMIWVVIKILMKFFEIIVDPYFDYLVFKDGLQSVTCKWLCRLNNTEQNIFLFLIKTVYIRFLEWVIHLLYHQTTITNAWGYE